MVQHHQRHLHAGLGERDHEASLKLGVAAVAAVVEGGEAWGQRNGCDGRHEVGVSVVVGMARNGQMCTHEQGKRE